MELERISVALRPRTPREAIDLGAVMLRAYARPVWTAWFAFSLPIAAACAAAGLLLGLPWLGMLLIWWLLPLFDRVPLYVLSRAVFDQAPGWRETLRGQRQWRWGGTMASLTWRRLDSHRALRLPLELLEGLPPAQRAARWRVLRRPIGGSATGLAYGCLQLALVLFASAFLFTALFIPSELLPDSLRSFAGDTARHAPTTMLMVATGVAYLAFSVIEPLYVAAGFALYLTRRTQLEAWDVDLAFRRLRHRWQEAGRVWMLLLALALGAPHALHAAEAKHEHVRVEDVFAQPVSEEDARFAKAAAEAYGDRRFGGPRKSYEWVLRHPPKPKEPERPPVDLEFAGNAFAVLVKILMWGLLAVAVAAIAWFVLRHMRLPMKLERRPREATLHTSLAMSEPEQPLPDDLAGATRHLWQGGRRREALALLYRGCVEQMAAVLQQPLPPDATEADCLRSARSMDDASRRQRVVAIVRAWQYAAYADRFPANDEIEALLVGWPAQRGGAA
jgi:hypothetical protein